MLYSLIFKLFLLYLVINLTYKYILYLKPLKVYIDILTFILLFFNIFINRIKPIYPN